MAWANCSSSESTSQLFFLTFSNSSVDKDFLNKKIKEKHARFKTVPLETISFVVYDG